MKKVIFKLLIIGVIYTISDSFADAFQIKERNAVKQDKTEESLRYNKLWHNWQAVRQGSFFLMVLVVSESIWFTGMMMALFWIAHDGTLNVFAFNLHFTYIGTTSKIDKIFRKLPYPEYMMLGVKIASLVGFGLIYLLKNGNQKNKNL